MIGAIRFYFDFSSPYGYLASRWIEAFAASHERKVDWCPHLLGIAMKETGQGPLLNQPMRGDYARHDLARMARELDVPLVWPEAFPVHSVAASRAFYYLKDRDAGLAESLARRLFHAYWAEGRDVSRPEDVAREAVEIGMDGDDLISAMQSDEVRQRLRDAVEHAMQRGIFGAPMFDLDGELFWGCDKRDQMQRWLERGGW